MLHTLTDMMEEPANTIKLPHPADTILSAFVQRIVAIQPAFIEGVYLTGSLSMNDFYSNKSDIDFLVLCKELPSIEITSQLKHIHQTIQKQFQKPDLSGSYLTLQSIKTDGIGNIKVLTYHQSCMRYGYLEMAPVSLWELQTNALTLYGEKAETLPVNIQPNVLYQFLYENINTYWRRWLKRHSTFLNRKIMLLLFPRLTEWAILGVARQFYTLQTGKIVSKTAAGEYCLKNLPEKFHPVIKDAISIRKDNRTFPFVKSYAVKPSFKRLSETIECVQFIITTFNKVVAGKKLDG